jgi:hypothetical protein
VTAPLLSQAELMASEWLADRLRPFQTRSLQVFTGDGDRRKGLQYDSRRLRPARLGPRRSGRS